MKVHYGMNKESIMGGKGASTVRNKGTNMVGNKKLIGNLII